MTEEPKPEQSPTKPPLPPVEEKSIVVYEVPRWQYYGLIAIVVLAIVGVGLAFYAANHSEPVIVSNPQFYRYAQALKLDAKEFNKCLEVQKYTDVVDEDFQNGVDLGIQGTPTFFINGKKVEGSLPYVKFQEIFEEELKNPNNNWTKNENLSKLLSGGTQLGDSKAPITMVEFSDFQCPFCQKFFKETLPIIKGEYIDKGKVLFIYKNFPLSGIHLKAQEAAEASLCAGDQDKFWEFHDVLFANQAKWSR